MTERLPTDVVEARLNHLIDRARRGALLPDEADRFTTELRDLVRRLEDTEDERDAALKAVDYFDAQSKRRKNRVTELTAEITRLTAGQCTHHVGMCTQHHTTPVDGCPYPKCVAARAAAETPEV
ncbi:hypothetical protein [Streptomyces sp. NPDC060322]|uniref:hypothetical protein n=1 Tax=Streptomyces sp. NPDC060322 TaxID=3347097 RepID=UPI0036573A42